MNLVQFISQYTERINRIPYLTHVLYDLNLLPEQIDNMQEAMTMAAIVEAYEQGWDDCYT